MSADGVVRLAGRADFDALRDLRLRALAGAPDDFDVSLAEARSWGEEAWHTWFTSRAIVVFERDGALRGMVAADRHDQDPRAYFIGAMWLDPTERGQGTAARLLKGIEDWAAEQGAERLLLHVVEGNRAACRAYERAGFAFSGVVVISARTNLRELELSKRIVQSRA